MVILCGLQQFSPRKSENPANPPLPKTIFTFASGMLFTPFCRSLVSSVFYLHRKILILSCLLFSMQKICLNSVNFAWGMAVALGFYGGCEVFLVNLLNKNMADFVE